MKFLIFLVALAALILGAIEAPVVDVENVHASNSTVQLGGAQADYKESLQLLFVGDKWNNNFHMLYHCPYGYGVDPCVDDPKCERIWIAFHGKSKWAGHSHPPLPKLFAKKWVPMLGANDCKYENDGSGEAGMLSCGSPTWWFRDFLKRDPRAGNAPRHCPNEMLWELYSHLSNAEY